MRLSLSMARGYGVAWPDVEAEHGLRFRLKMARGRNIAWLEVGT